MGRFLPFQARSSLALLVLCAAVYPVLVCVLCCASSPSQSSLSSEGEFAWQQYVPEQYRGYAQQQRTRDGRGHGAGGEKDGEAGEASEGRLRVRRTLDRERRVEQEEDSSVRRTHSGKSEKLRLSRTERERESERVDGSVHGGDMRAREEEADRHEEDESRGERRRHGRADARSHQLAAMDAVREEGVPTAATAESSAPKSHCSLSLLAVCGVSIGCMAVLLLIRACLLSHCCAWQRCRERWSGSQYRSIQDKGDDSGSEQLLH